MSKRTVVITLVDGHDLKTWLYAGSIRDMGDLINGAKAWAKTAGFNRMTVTPLREVWSRLLAPHGFVKDEDGDLIYQIRK